MPAPPRSFSPSSSASPSSPAAGGCRTFLNAKTAVLPPSTPSFRSTPSSSFFRFLLALDSATAISRSSRTSSASPSSSPWCSGPPPCFAVASLKSPKSLVPASGYTRSLLSRSFSASSLFGRASFPPTIRSPCLPSWLPRLFTPLSARSSSPLPSLLSFCAIVLCRAGRQCSSPPPKERCPLNEQRPHHRACVSNQAQCLHRTHQAGRLFPRPDDHRCWLLHGRARTPTLAAYAARHLRPMMIAAGTAALNHYIERESDRYMRRTA